MAKTIKTLLCYKKELPAMLNDIVVNRKCKVLDVRYINRKIELVIEYDCKEIGEK